MNNGIFETVNGFGMMVQLQTWTEVLRLLLNLSIATILGSLLAFHPVRLRSGFEVEWEIRKSQMLLCVAAAIIIIIIDGSVARAFALAGLGSFIRFRTDVRNPLDISLIFVLITVGMACGLGYVKFAIVCTAFIFVLIYVVNFREPRYTQVWELKTAGGVPDQCRVSFERLAEEQLFKIDLIDLNLMKGVFTAKFRPPYGLIVSEVDEGFRSRCQTQPEAVLWNRLQE